MKRKEVIASFKAAGAKLNDTENKVIWHGKCTSFPPYKEIDRIKVMRMERELGMPKGAVFANG
jgi:hypothetical protein